MKPRCGGLFRHPPGRGNSDLGGVDRCQKPVRKGLVERCNPSPLSPIGGESFGRFFSCSAIKPGDAPPSLPGDCDSSSHFL
jgi:hypothetical protein